MSYDVIVIGAGTMGCAASHSLAKRRLNVLALEQFSVPHDLGSHSGYTRIIRQAYYEHPGYVPLLQRSYQLWKNLEQDHHTRLYHETGILYMGQPSSPILNGTQHASDIYKIPLSSPEISRMQTEHPQFKIPSDWKLLWEPYAGYLNVNPSIAAFYHQAVNTGARILSHEKMVSWKMMGDHIKIQTLQETYLAEKIIFTSGSWTGELLGPSSLPLKVTRQVLAWIEVPDALLYSHPQFPCWFLHDPARGMFYGFPLSKTGDPDEPKGIKLGLHMPGVITHPDQIDRDIHETDQETIRYFIETYMPQLRDQPIQYKTCMYTYTPDEHFILDYLPGTGKKVMVAGGFSGHGFKFAPVIGEILADLCLEKSTGFDLEFLNLERFGLK